MPPISPTHAAPPPPTFGDTMVAFFSWCRREPFHALLVAAMVAVLVYFVGFYELFMSGTESLALWVKRSWNAENDLEHGWFIAPAALLLLWYHRAELRDAPKRGSSVGLLFVIGGIALFVLSARTLQPRVALLALPVVFYGMTHFLWGRAAARIVIFPCALLLFLIPVGFIVSQTVGLQTFTAAFASTLSTFIGIPVSSDGAALRALDGSFQFEVAGGCSGIRSLTAMTMLAALYVHFTQRELWKKAVIFGCSLIFALIGNLFRIFTVVLFARFIDPQIAAGIYHDYSGFIFFPIAVGAMVGFSNLLNRDWRKLFNAAMARETFVPSDATPAPQARAGRDPGGPISYDY